MKGTADAPQVEGPRSTEPALDESYRFSMVRSCERNIKRYRNSKIVAGTSFWSVWTSPAYGGSGSKRLGLLPHARYNDAYRLNVDLILDMGFHVVGGLGIFCSA